MPKESYGIWPNQGQITDLDGNPVPEVSFYTSGALPRAYFQKSGLFSLVLATGDSTSLDTLRQLDIACVGPNAFYPDPIVWEMKDQYANFFFPTCGPNGVTNVHPYLRVIYPGMYPLIDMHVYSGRMGQKLAFVINPGGDPKDIELMLTGQDELDVDIYGNLKILMEGKWVILPEAIAYQVEWNGTIIPVNWTAGYEVHDNQATVRFDFEQFDHSKPLVYLIGPAALGGTPNYEEEGLCWSTYYGGDIYDYAKDAKGDANGNVYVGGRTYSSFGSFPNQPGITPGYPAAGYATLTKFNPGNELQWTNYFGGVDDTLLVGSLPRGTFGEVVAVRDEPSTMIYLAGTTTAPNIAMLPEIGAYNDPGTYNVWNKGFIAKFDSAGFIHWSTYFGLGTKIQGMDLWGPGSIVVSGVTGNGGLPTPPAPPPPPALDLPFGGGTQDGFFAAFDANDQLYWRSYYGGSGQESGVLVRSLSDGGLCLAGNTTAADIEPVDQGSSYSQTYGGGQDCFIVCTKPVGTVIWATYLGGSGNETLGPKGLALSHGDILLAGVTAGLPTLVHGPNWYDDSPSATDPNGFIARFERDYFAPKWISYLGSGPDHFPWCLGVDQEGVISVGGYSNDPEFEPLQRPGYFYQPDYQADTLDGFLTQFDEEQHRLLNTHFGGLTEGVAGQSSNHIPENIMSLNTINGSLYATGYTEKRNMPVNSYFPLDNSTGTPWFNDQYNGNGYLNLYSDGFIAQFCNEMIIGIAEAPGPPETGMQVLPAGPEAIVLTHLPDGPHTLKVYDAEGRLVLDRHVHSSAGRSDEVQLDPGSALYIFRVDGVQTAKYIPVR